jgi:hypothetical protein
MFLLLERCIHCPGKYENSAGNVTFFVAVEHQNLAGRFCPVKSVWADVFFVQWVKKTDWAEIFRLKSTMVHSTACTTIARFVIF